MSSVPDDDDWNPNNFPPREYRVYGGKNLDYFAIVDYEDYMWAMQWLWGYVKNTSQKGRARLTRLVYISRMTRAVGNRDVSVRKYLHIEIMKRTGIEPPSSLHRIVNHKNSNTLDCRRENLEWETYSGNNRKAKQPKTRAKKVKRR